MAATKDYFIERYHAVTNDKYDGWFLPNGILEIGRVLGPNIVEHILKGCLPPVSLPDRHGSFEKILDDMERGKLPEISEPSLEDVTEPDTSVFALSYRHLQSGTKELPRRRMKATQKRHLINVVTEVASRRNSTRVILWIDQAMGQRNPIDERDWVRHGILPYFAFDILVLLEEYDLTRCWIFLEGLIAQKTSHPENVLQNAILHEKSYQFGTISPIQEVASAVLSGALVEKDAYDKNDKEEIRRWAAQLLEQKDAHGDKYANLLGGSSWKSRIYDGEGLLRVIMNHTVPQGEVQWRDLSNQNKDGKFHGLSELMGLPDREATCDGRNEVNGIMKKLGNGYRFHIFSAISDEDPSIKAIAIGVFLRSGRPSRTLLCALDGMENDGSTHVLYSCILDCDEVRDSGALDFITAFKQFGKKQLDTWRTLRHIEDSPLVNTPKREMEALHATVLSKIFKWAWFCNALRKVHVVLSCYVELLQAGDVMWG